MTAPRKQVLLVVTIVLVQHYSVTASRPLYMRNVIGSASFSQQRGRELMLLGGQQQQHYSVWKDACSSLYRQAGQHNTCYRPTRTTTTSVVGGFLRQRRRLRPHSLLTRRLIPIVDILEPLETVWEFYCNRDDIMLEMVQRGASFCKKNSVRAIGFLLMACSAAQVLCLLGVIGDKGDGLVTELRESERLREYGIERVCQRTAASVTDSAVGAVRQFRKFGSRSKFALAVSFGALFANAAVNITTLSVKLGISSFLVLEGLSFAGVIGEPGESLGEWIDTHDSKAEWVKKTRDVQHFVRNHVSLDALETFYEAAVDEEKVACAGFAIGSILSMFT